MPLENSGPAAEGYSDGVYRIQKVRYTHEALIDLIIANPNMTQIELGQAMGYSRVWISRIIGSDAFQQALAARKTEIINPVLVQSVEDRLRGLAVLATDVLAENLEATRNPDTALRALEISTKSLGFGARSPTQTNVQNNFVVALPTKAQTAEEWAANLKPVKSAEPEG